jgi:hypothetical protein
MRRGRGGTARAQVDCFGGVLGFGLFRKALKGTPGRAHVHMQARPQGFVSGGAIVMKCGELGESHINQGNGQQTFKSPGETGPMIDRPHHVD